MNVVNSNSKKVNVRQDIKKEVLDKYIIQMKDNGIKDTTINIRIDMASQYEIIFDENNRKLEVKLDNGQNLKITVINKKGTL